MDCAKCGDQTGDKKATAVGSDTVSNHMVGAILTTVFCCMIGGIVSIVYASKVNTKLAQGDINGARAASKAAKGWIIASMIIGFLSGLLIMGTLFPAVSASMQAANASAASMRGRNLFIAIVQSSVEREAVGLPSAWPHTADSSDLSPDKKDISGIAFKTSTDYFRTLFDTASMGKDDWAPYVAGVNTNVLKLSKGSGFCDWIVAANVKEEFDDVIPVLISANVDPAVLKTSFDGVDNTPIPFGSKVGRTKLPWCDDFVIVIRKGGAAQVFKRRHFTYSMLYNKQSFSAPGLKYLDVE